jgi:hypothetical protein
MKCKDCLLWQNKRDDLAGQISTLIPQAARYYGSSMTEETKQAIYTTLRNLKEEYKELINIGEKEHRPSRCHLLPEALK